jgi:diguanylate cyclase (GGDEF)-like protein
VQRNTIWTFSKGLISLKAKTSRNITASIGVSELQAKDKLSEFIRRADKNLYAAKAEGKNRVIFI